MTVQAKRSCTSRLFLATSAAILAALPGGRISAQPVQTPAPVAKPAEQKRMQDYLRVRNDPRVIRTTIHSQNSDDIDCVDETMQYGFDSAPTPVRQPPLELFKNLQTQQLPRGAVVAQQEYGTETERCPPHTVPRVHLSIETLSQYASLEEYQGHGKIRSDLPQVSANHEYANAYQTVAADGLSTIMSINNPADEHSEEFSLSQLWALSAQGFANQETAEAGWQRYRGKYGQNDFRPHWFVFWSTNQYHRGCYNQECPGFVVQAGTSHMPAGAITNWSKIGGTQVYSSFLLVRDTYGDWWLQIDNDVVGWFDHTLIGYNMFGGMGSGATMVEYGGEVNPGVDYGRHSTIDMGSGRWPETGWGQAAFHTGIQHGRRVASQPNGPLSWSYTSLLRNNSRYFPGCYSLAFADPPNNTAFYFGGPGYSSVDCPTVNP